MPIKCSRYNLFAGWLLSIVTLSPAFAWGPNGHRITAEICSRYLSDEARSELEGLLGKDYLAELSTWPDYVRSERGWDFAETWHYTTVHMNQSVEDVREKYQRDSTINDATEAITFMIDVLKDDQRAISMFEEMMDNNRARPYKNSTRATALAFLIHLVGDIHQPLHVGKNKDLGGNKITTLFFDERTNLHSVWDSKIIEHEKLSYTEFANFIDKLPEEEIRSLQEGSLNDWARESIELRENIYRTLYDYTDRDTGLPSFSWNYQHDNIIHVQRRLVESGIRLAGLLNDIFG